MAKLTKEELAAKLNGREYMNEITKAEAAEAKAAGLIVIFGYSDDNVELRGAIHEEVGAYDGTTLHISHTGALQGDIDSLLDERDKDGLESYFRAKAAGTHEVEALWSADPDYSWTFKTGVPHATFEIVEGGEKFCRGIVIEVADLKPAQPPMADAAPAGLTLSALDAAFEAEIVRVSHVLYDSNEICRHFYGELRKRVAGGVAA